MAFPGAFTLTTDFPDLSEHLGKRKQLHGHGCLQLQGTGPVNTQGPSQGQARLELMCMNRELGTALELFPRWADFISQVTKEAGKLLRAWWF